MKKFLFLFWCCILFGFTYAIEISADVLYLLAVEIIADWEATKEQMVWIFQSCEKNNKKLSKQCKEVLQKLWETEKQSETAAEEKLWILKEVIDWGTITVEANGLTYNIKMIWVDARGDIIKHGYLDEWGEWAKEHLKTLLQNKTITLEFDETQGEEDKYGRKLAYIIADWININKQMIEDWYSRSQYYAGDTSYKYRSEFEQAEKDAQSKDNWLRAIIYGVKPKDGESTNMQQIRQLLRPKADTRDIQPANTNIKTATTNTRNMSNMCRNTYNEIYNNYKELTYKDKEKLNRGLLAANCWFFVK